MNIMPSILKITIDYNRFCIGGDRTTGRERHRDDQPWLRFMRLAA